MNRTAFLLITCLTLAVSGSCAMAQTPEQIEMVAKIQKQPQTKASTLSFLAGVAQGENKFDEALEYYNAMLKIYAADPGLTADCPKYAWILTRRAQCEKAIGKNDEAVADSKNALEIIAGLTPSN